MCNTDQLSLLVAHFVLCITNPNALLSLLSLVLKLLELVVKVLNCLN